MIATGGVEAASLMTTGLYRAALVVGLATWLAAGCGPRAEERATVRVSESRRLMGAPWTITVHAASRGAGSEAIAAAFTEIERLDGILSDYDPASELSRLSAAAPTPEPVAVGADLWRVLVAAESLRERSAGAFDIAIGPLTSLWRQARKSGRLPRPAKLAAARAAAGPGTVELVPETRSVRLPKPGTRLDPGGIGMGYAADRALEVLARRGIAAAMIDASGDVLVSAPPPGTAGWRIAVAPLRPGGEGEAIVLARAAVTTSGDAYQGVEIDGVRYSHVVDPRSGLGVAGPTTVTLVAPDATTADALATAVSVLGHEAGPAVIGAFPGCSARFAWRESGVDRVLTTAGWPGELHEP
jgi:thiamine biosynthesis lipoprotein